MKTSLKLLIVASLLSCIQFAQAQSVTADNADILSYSIDELVQRYPADSIQSTETANEALKAVSEARARLDTRLTAEEQICYPKFFTTSCLNKAAEHKRLDLLAVRAIEIEANAYIRHARVETRDRKLEESAREREAKNAANPILVTPKTDDAAPAEASGKTDAQRKARADAYVKKNAEHAQRQQELQQKEASGAAGRAANVEKYEEKQKEAEKRQKEIAERKAEKERIKAAKAAKAAKENAPVTGSGN
jgi:colicin import membrane protein